MAIYKEEIFGPVLTITPFKTEEDAIRMANDTDYGLPAYIQTSDMQRAKRVAAQLRVGGVHLNGGGYNYSSPFGGYKQSGIGREGGISGALKIIWKSKLYMVLVNRRIVMEQVNFTQNERRHEGRI